MFGLRAWLLRPVSTTLKRIIMNQTELAQSLRDVKTQADKAKTEIVAKVQTLEDTIAAGGPVSDDVAAALADLRGSVQGLDDLNPDAPQAEPEPTREKDQANFQPQTPPGSNEPTVV